MREDTREASAQDRTTIIQLESHLQYQLMGRVSDLRLEICGSGLVLEGHAPTYYAKQLAQHAVMQATDLPILANKIDVS